MLHVHEIFGRRDALLLSALVESPAKSLANIISCREYITAAVDVKSSQLCGLCVPS